MLKTTLKNPSLACHRIEPMAKVKTFLDSIGRNSKQSRKIYNLGLGHFQNFLDNDYNEKSKQPFTLTVETILQPLVQNEIDLYGLLDGFVSYLMTLIFNLKLNPLSDSESQSSLSVNTIMVYLTAIKSYLAYYDIDVIPSKFKRRVKIPKMPREDGELGI